jgi:HK97 family phage prohead protease
MENKVVRYTDTELRAIGDDKNSVEGVAVVFNQQSDMGWFVEEIDAHALDEADMSDVVLNFNHDNSLLLAGTRNGSLSLDLRNDGLYQTSKIIDTTQGRDVMMLVQSGLISKMSFAFTIARDGEEWTERDGKEYRKITKIDRLYDVSLVTFPAYSQTSAWARGNSDDLAERHKALMERRAEQDKKLEEILGE